MLKRDHYTMANENFTKVIGYYARLRGIHLFCNGPACIITSSERALKNAIHETKPEDITRCTIHKTRFVDILSGLLAGGYYAFDQGAYQRFYPLACKEGLEALTAPEEFPTDAPYLVVNLDTYTEPQTSFNKLMD